MASSKECNINVIYGGGSTLAVTVCRVSCDRLDFVSRHDQSEEMAKAPLPDEELDM